MDIHSTKMFRKIFGTICDTFRPTRSLGIPFAHIFPLEIKDWHHDLSCIIHSTILATLLSAFKSFCGGIHLFMLFNITVSAALVMQYVLVLCSLNQDITLSGDTFLQIVPITAKPLSKMKPVNDV